LPSAGASHLFKFFPEIIKIYILEECLMRKLKVGILLLVVLLAMVSVASAALPSSVTATLTFPGSSSYYEVYVSSGGLEIPTGAYIGWCADSETYGVVSPATYVPYDSRVEAPSGMHYVDWKRVNYIINHDDGYMKGSIQRAVWYYDGGGTSWPDADGGAYTDAEVKALTDAADAMPSDYVPSSPGEVYAVILWNNANVQPIFIEVPIGSDVPEFPTLAVPVGMLIGLVGVVEVVRTRKE
jgi:hypothetical protein